MMNIATTNGITVSVSTEYQAAHSTPKTNTFLYCYRITIENDSPHAVQLLGRYWQIKDAALPLREVRGEGVIGEQPILESGGRYEYESWTEMRSEIGVMRGNYLMQRQFDGATFEIDIPAFSLFFPFKKN